MQPNTWYQVQIFPTQNPASSPISYLVQMLAISDYTNTNFIIYDSNMALGYLDILAPLASNGSLSVIVNTTSSTSTIPASIYTADIYVTPTVSSSTGGNFTLSIYYDSTDVAMSSTTSIIDFSFMGLCQSTATNVGSAAVLLFCSISSDLSTITFAMSSVVAGTAIRITTSIANPLYYSIRGINSYWTEFISGRVIENGKQNNALMVNKISVNTITNRVQLLWGVDSAYSDTLFPQIPLFKAQLASPNIIPYNSFNIGFSFTQTSPINGQYTVKMTLGAMGILEGSIAHNLPTYQSTSVFCSYDTTNKQIVCTNVGPFISTAYRYFISGKACFASTTTTPLTTFGDVYILPVVYDSNGNLLTLASLYTPLTPALPIVVQTSNEFLDSSSGGYHDISTYSVGNAQVVSYYDDETLSSTANGIKGFLQGSNSTVGVVPNIGYSQQLLFLLKTPTSIYSGASTSHSLTTLLIYNPNVISF